MKLLNRIKFVIYFVKGKYALIDGDYLDALEYFEKASKYNTTDYALYTHKALTHDLATIKHTQNIRDSELN